MGFTMFMIVLNEGVNNATGAIFVAAINGHDLAAIYDFDTFIEELIVCNWYIKTQHIKNMHLVVNT